MIGEKRASRVLFRRWPRCAGPCGEVVTSRPKDRLPSFPKQGAAYSRRCAAAPGLHDEEGDLKSLTQRKLDNSELWRDCDVACSITAYVPVGVVPLPGEGGDAPTGAGLLPFLLVAPLQPTKMCNDQKHDTQGYVPLRQPLTRCLVETCSLSDTPRQH